MALDPSYTPDPEDETKPADSGVAMGYAFKEIRFLKNYIKDKLTTTLLPHIANMDNPHGTTKALINLPNVPDWDSSTDPALGGSDTTFVSQKAIRDAIGLALSNKVYPVGAYYITESSTSPDVILGFGTWVRLEAGRTLVAREATDNLSPYYVAGTQGGAESRSITSNNLPQHTHPIIDSGHTHTYSKASESFVNGSLDSGTTGSIAQSSVSTSSSTTGITVGNNATTSTPLDIRSPYRVVNIWRREA